MRSRHLVIAALSAAGSIILNSSGFAQQIQKTEIPSVSAGDGPAMYKAYCAACHGVGGKGDGPAAKALKTAASDLTVLSRDNYGAFPALAVLATLRRGGGVHGSEDMPVWGEVFRQSHQDDTAIHLRTYNLVRYLESIQEPTAPPLKKVPAEKELKISDVRPHFGGDMYRAYCASCHGVDGWGNGPSAYTLKKTPTDLTKLRGPDGKFPATKVQAILSEVGTSAHGSAEMPLWGDMFRATQEDPSISKLRIYNLTRYLESIQR
jgi:mono/diheme cytochrome c family protein